MFAELIAVASIVILVLGVSTIFWGSMGLSRIVAGRTRQALGRRSVTGWALQASRLKPETVRRSPDTVSVTDVAILIAAHNEEVVIGETLKSASTLVGMNQVFVVSDGSKDATAAIAAKAGANVYELNPNRGKAGAIVAAIDYFALAERFEVLMLLDADTVLAPDYMTTGLPLFSDSGVVAVAGRAKTRFDPPAGTLIGRILVAYRERVYIAVQLILKFGQASSRTNVVSIVPGFASMYRTRILSSIDIAAPGFTIEDYNMTFEIHAKSLGRIDFQPAAATAYTQDPDNLHDYRKQIGRWSLGFWQTVVRHPWQPHRFWVALYIGIAELVASSILTLLMLPLIAFALVTEAAHAIGGAAALGGLTGLFGIPSGLLVLGFVLPDYLVTLFATVASRRPSFLVYGLVFPFLRVLDAAVCLRRIPEAFRGSSNGVWTSPERRVSG